MVTIRDFIENNENVLIIIETAETRNTTDPLRRNCGKVCYMILQKIYRIGK